MLIPAFSMWLAAIPLPLAEKVSSFTFTCVAKARAGLQAFGGIGGVAYAGNNRWWMASEGLPLIFPVWLDLQESRLRPRIGKPIRIHGDPRGEEFKKVESLTLCRDQLAIGTEAMMAKELKSGKDQDLRVIFTDLQGGYKSELSLPDHYQRIRPGVGSVYYRGIQGLSCSPDGRQLLVSLQRPLQQDGNTGLSRQLLYRWNSSQKRFQLVREFAVKLDLQLGLMDSVLLGNGTALMLENEVKPQQRNALSSYQINDGNDIQACFSLVNCQIRPAAKTMLIDHLERDSAVDLAANEVQYDALGIGPVLQDGRRTLLLVNDDDHCGTLSNPTSSISPGFAGTTFTRVLLPAVIPGEQR